MWSLRRAAVLFAAWLLLATLAHAGTVILEWDLDAYTAANAVGLKVYYGTAPGVYGAPVLIPVPSPVQTYTISGLDAGNWYFTVSAYDGASETALSNEVTAVVPQPVGGFGRRPPE